MRNRLFTPQELDELGLLTADAVEAAIDSGDDEKAKKLTKRMHKEFMSVHDLYLYWVTALLTFIGREYGEKALGAAFRETCAAWMKPLVEPQLRRDLRTRFMMLAYGLKGHGQPFHVYEDDEKLAIRMTTCATGGRLILEGAYAAPLEFLRIRDAQPMTYGKKDFPVYCAHCPWQEILPIEWTGEPWFITECGQGERPCEVYVYKDAASIPTKYYERIGMVKR